ncbi:MAG: phage portal protein [Pirellulales bacterium]
MPHDNFHNTLQRLSQYLAEAIDDEPLRDEDGLHWRPLGGGYGGVRGACGTFLNETELAMLREECRRLAATNEYAINGHENRISFIVGAGHTYRATVRKGAAADELAARVQDLLDDFIERNNWHARQQEIVRRRDRDGEAFLRFFADASGDTRVRFVEPDQVAAPSTRLGEPASGFGIVTDTDDVETILAYYIDGRAVDASEIQHRKAHVDANVKRGLPLYYPVRKNLRRAEKLLRNMSAVAEIQSAIALIRRHQRGTRGALEAFAASSADSTQQQPGGGRATNFRRYEPGTILDVSGNVEYDFPAAGLDAGRYVAVLQAELRAIASRLVMPEFMLSSDASNANYASTMVAEGPAMRMFERLQAEQVADDLAVMRRVVRNAIAAGRLPVDTLRQIAIEASPPSLAQRDALAEVQAFRIEHELGILSPQTWSQLRGLDYDQEQQNLSAHNASRAIGEATS